MAPPSSITTPPPNQPIRIQTNPVTTHPISTNPDAGHNNHTKNPIRTHPNPPRRSPPQPCHHADLYLAMLPRRSPPRHATMPISKHTTPIRPMAATRERKWPWRQVDREEGEEGEMKNTDRGSRRHTDLHLAMPPHWSANPLRWSDPRQQPKREIDHGGK